MIRVHRVNDGMLVRKECKIDDIALRVNAFVELYARIHSQCEDKESRNPAKISRSCLRCIKIILPFACHNDLDLRTAERILVSLKALNIRDTDSGYAVYFSPECLAFFGSIKSIPGSDMIISESTH